MSISETVLRSQGLTVARDKYGPIPTEDFFKFTPPALPDLSASVVLSLIFLAPKL